MKNKTDARRCGPTESFLRVKTLIVSLTVLTALAISSLALYTRMTSTQALDKKMPTLKGDPAVEYLKRESNYDSLENAFTSIAADDLRDNPEAMVKLIPNDGVAGGYFGSSVAISGDTAIIGATNLPEGNGGSIPGAAYIFVRTGASWTFQQKLTAPDVPPGNGNAFGDTVGISGDTVVVAAPQHMVLEDRTGAAYVFVRTGTTWSLQKRFTNADTPLVFNGDIGFSVAISGDTVLVTAFGFLPSSPHRHFVHVFVREGTTWTIQATLITGGDDTFRSRVAISGNTAVIGNPNTSGTRQEAAYIYVRCGTTWTQQQRLTQSDGSGFEDFGGSVAISGNTVIIGAQYDQINANQRGSAYIFATDGTTWTEQAKLTGSVHHFDFGQSVAILGDTAIVGEPVGAFAGGNQAGSADVFVRSGTTWTRDTTITAPDGQPSDYFGWSVAISSELLFVGAIYDDFGSNNQTNEGSAWAIDRITAEPPPFNPCETEIEVNITTDQPDADIDDDVCDVDANEPGEQCSMRAAIETANAKDGPDEISFNIPGAGPHTISPAAALPAITEKVLIDATTQPGYSASPLVELSGNGGFAGLAFAAGSGDSSVSGIAVNRFLTGISLQTNGVKIERSYIGLRPDGSPGGMVSVQQVGIEIETAAASNNTVGGPANLRNVISNNTVGVAISQGATGNKVLGNLIGTGPAGTAARPNQTGVLINSANNNEIGDGTPERVNIISGNAGNGVEVIQTTGTKVKGNKIGITASATALGNSGHGIVVRNSPGTAIGGEAANEGNVICNNGGNGILVETTPGNLPESALGPLPTTIRGNHLGVTLDTLTGSILRLGNGVKGILIKHTSGVKIGSVNAGNAIGANVGAGIELEGSGAEFNELIGNLIGGIKNLQGQVLTGGGNGGDGVRLMGVGTGNRIGSNVAGAANTIINNGGNGILVDSSMNAPGSHRPVGGPPTVIEGNNVGVGLNALTGSILRLGNGLIGVLVKETPGVKIGGINAGNAIGANVGAGVVLDGPGAEFNELIGNLIGGIKNLQGQVLTGGGNGGDGVRVIGGGAGNRIGSGVAGAANTIINNSGNGILIDSSGNAQKSRRAAGAEPTVIEGNSVGVTLDNLTGSILRLGNGLIGVLVKETPGVKIGGINAGNAIGANVGAGVVLDGPGAEFNELIGNLIGGIKNLQGQVLSGGGNGGDGVRVIGGGAGNRIGSGVAGAANTIINNSGNGILIDSSGNAQKSRRAAGAEPTVIEGNSVGVTLNNLTGSILRLGNGLKGVLLKETTGVKVGGINAGNAIGANVGAGIEIDGPGAELNELIGNVIGGIKNLQGQILSGGGNGGDGVRIAGGSVGNRIGSSVNGAANTIISNAANGILVESDPGPPRRRGPSQPTVIEGNNLGVTLNVLSGSIVRLGNNLSGVLVKASGVKIGGTGVGAGNSIGANVRAGVEIDGPAAELNEIVGNLIGSIKNLQGQILPGGGNDGDGVKINGAPRNRILSNFVTANGGNGISLLQASQTQIGDANAGNTVVQNLLDAIVLAQSESSKAWANYLGVIKQQNGEFVAAGNGGNGINSVNSDGVQIGDVDAALANVIAANQKLGVLMDQATELLIMRNNLVGTVIRGIGNSPNTARPSAQEFGNGHGGVRISNLSGRNVIGGPEPNSGNVIANNGGPGVWIDETAGNGNLVDPNSIYGNAGPGIALGDIGHTPNDPTDADIGPNKLQNYPTFALSINGGNLIVSYQIDSAPQHSTYGGPGIYVEFFEADTTGAGRDFLGSDHYLLSDYTNGTPGTRQKNLGNAAALGIAPGDVLTATATDAEGNSSEFTPAVSAPGGAPGFEGDVAPRPNGDGVALSTDITQLRRFVTGLDTPNPATNEVQRADCAPRASSGDGAITSGDVVQARRYVTGLDPQTAAGGPTATSIIPESVAAMFGDVYPYSIGRELRVGKANELSSGKRVSVPIEIISNGDEVAISFTLEYDETKLTNPRLALGEASPEGATLTINTNVPGRIGVLIDWNGPIKPMPLPGRLVSTTFDIASDLTADSRISLTNNLAAMSASDPLGNTLGIRHIDGTVHIGVRE